jgi:hypothetical protein
VHYTPRHGSWLNQAEIEIGLFSRQCLGKRRIPTPGQLATEAQGLEPNHESQQGEDRLAVHTPQSAQQVRLHKKRDHAVVVLVPKKVDERIGLASRMAIGNCSQLFLDWVRIPLSPPCCQAKSSK